MSGSAEETLPVGGTYSASALCFLPLAVVEFLWHHEPWTLASVWWRSSLTRHRRTTGRRRCCSSSAVFTGNCNLAEPELTCACEAVVMWSDAEEEQLWLLSAGRGCNLDFQTRLILVLRRPSSSSCLGKVTCSQFYFFLLDFWKYSILFFTVNKSH